MSPHLHPLRRIATVAVIALAVAMAALLPILRAIADRLLESDAEQSALAWASHVVSTVPHLEARLRGDALDAGLREQLAHERNANDVFRFKLFDRQARLLLDSDHLDSPPAPAPAGAGGELGHGNQALQAQVLAGRADVELHRGGKPGLPAVYSEAYVPIVQHGRVLGVVEVYVNQAARQARIHDAFVRVAAAVFAALALAGLVLGRFAWARLKRQRQAEDQARYLVEHDVLSGLLNRTSFGAALREASWRHAGGGPGFALLTIDLDHFGEINDSLGHALGDEVLRQTGDRLRALVRQGDRVARLGADAFGVIQGGSPTAEAAATLGARIVEALAEPMLCGGRSLVCGASVGITLAAGREPMPGVEALLNESELAMQRAKADGRGRVSFYDAALDAESRQRRQLTHDLRAAIGTAQLSLHYQPLVASDGHTVTGYEALLRWQHPQRGPLPPSLFIPLAEEAGLIETLGEWVLVSACAQAARWPGAQTVAVNLSPAQFASGCLVDQVRQALDAAGLAPQRLELEVTESLLLGHTEQVRETLQALSALGVRIAMDDFGTGYSSLAYLWQFPFDKLKIDRAFTRHLGQDPRVDLIVGAIVSLAHAMNLRVNAEGVETAAQHALLRAHGCDEFQGYLFGRPQATPSAAVSGAPARADHQSPALSTAGD